MPILLSRAVAVICAVPLAGCMAYSNAEFDTDRTPIVNVGSRASIIYPGQGGPGFPQLPPPPGTASRQGAYGQSTSHNSASPQQPRTGGSTGDPHTILPGQQPAPGVPPQQAHAYQPPSDPNAGMMLLGGAREDITTHKSVREDPLFLKYLAAPIAIAAAPFVLAREAIGGEPAPGPAVPRPPNPQAPAPAPRTETSTYEQTMLRNMQQELSQRQGHRRNPRTAGGSAGPATPHEPLSIADELDALQRVSDAPRSEPHDPAPQASTPTASGRTSADGIVDRNDDGRVDQWIYRESGEIVREELDEDFDGRVDRIVHIDLDTHQVSVVEEDNHGDGRVDTWTQYTNGAIARRRSDSDADGSVDTWSFYRNGELARHEQDTTHDGYRDAISFYVDSRRVRETRDFDADGQPETELFFDAHDQLARQQEDRDGDGFAEIVSHYHNGRLTRRELFDAPELAAQDTDPAGAAVR